MLTPRIFILLLGLCLFSGLLLRADPETKPTSDSLAAIAASLKWQTGMVTLKNGLAKITLTDDFRFLDHENTEKVLHDIWGNPPDPDTLGMIFPANLGPLDKGSWGVVIQYEENGYVKDDDAEKIDYTALLKQMQQQVTDANPERIKEGYPSFELVGWAAPPRYDKATHKLYWAKDIKVGDDSIDTLNYNIRVLGRRGVLSLNAIAAMSDFPAIDQKIPEVLSMVDFQTGNQYADFDPKIDKIAEYGLATLVAGGALGAAAKLGLLALVWKYILFVVLALKKVLIVAVVAVVSLFKRIVAMFRGKPSSTPERLLPPQNQTPVTPEINPPVPPPARPSPPAPFIPPPQE